MRKFIAFCTSLFVAITFLTAGTGQALAAPDYSIVRVNLLSLGSPTTLTVTLSGNYSIPENGQVDLQQKSYQIKVLNGQLNLIDGTTTIPMGTKFIFKRHEGSGSGIKINNSNNYSGDMEAQIYGGYIRMINHVYLETYLYGVVPYEISNSWPMEVLKAQAIAARTYAVRYKSSGAFDVYDTQASQVYRGYNANYGNAIKAVDQTAGKVLKYGSSFVDASYSSSNGGKTQSAGNTWGGSNPGYSVIKDDPYDIKNTSNPNRSWTVVCSKAGEKLNAALTTNFKNALKTTLENKGYSGVPGDITIKEVKSVSIDAKDSGDRLTKGKVTLSLDVKNKTTSEIETVEQSIDLNKSNTRNMLNLNSLLFMVNETETAFELKGSGWGHGVGMSQYGAYQMALEGFNYAQILDFYYPNTSTDTLSIKPPVLTPKPDRGDKPAPEPPKEDPPKVDPPAQSLYGTIKVSSNLNVRSGPGTGYGIVGSLKNGAQVEILEKGGSWHKIKSGNITGYVSSQYVQISNTPSTPPDKPVPPTNPPDATPPSEKYGTVTASKLNVRTGPGTRNSVVGYVYRGNRVKVLSSSGGWHKISYGSLTGYVSDDYIKLETSGGGSTPPPTNPTPPAQTVTGKGTVTASSLTVRSGPSTGNSKIGSLARNATVNIVGSSGVWYKIQYGSGTGYVHGDYIKLQTGGGNTTPPPTNPTPTNPTPPAQTVTGKGTVTASSLIVRSGPSTGSSKLGSLARNATVNIVGSSGVWYKIQYGSGTGYVHGDYIKVTSGTPTPGRGDDGSSGRTGIVNASALNLRTGPGTNYTSIKLLKKGETVQILSQSGVWLQIKSNDGKTGYVHKDYVK